MIGSHNTKVMNGKETLPTVFLDEDLAVEDLENDPETDNSY
jgi:hypothetical protein